MRLSNGVLIVIWLSLAESYHVECVFMLTLHDCIYPDLRPGRDEAGVMLTEAFHGRRACQGAYCIPP